MDLIGIEIMRSNLDPIPHLRLWPAGMCIECIPRHPNEGDAAEPMPGHLPSHKDAQPAAQDGHHKPICLSLRSGAVATPLGCSAPPSHVVDESMNILGSLGILANDQCPSRGV